MKNPIYLTSRTNQTVKEFVRMAASPSSGFFLVEGSNFVFDLDMSLLKAVLICREEKYKKETEEFLKNNIPVYFITESISEKISSTKNEQEIMAFTSKKGVNMPTRLLLLDKIQDPGNMGTMIRSAVSFGFGIIYSEDSANPFSTKSVRSSAGTLQKCFLKKANLKKEIFSLKEKGFKIFSSELDKNAEIPDNIERYDKIALIIGNESSGVSETLSAAAGKKIYIPINSDAESLNAAAAASILMYNFRKIN